MEELNKLEKLEVEDIINKGNYCEVHCKQFFVSNKHLNHVLYIIGTIIFILSGVAVGYTIPQAVSESAYNTKVDQAVKDIESLKSINATMDSVWTAVKQIKNSR